MPDQVAADDRLDRLEAMLTEVLGRLDQPAARYLTIDATAAYTGISAESVRRLVASGKLTGLRPVRGRLVIDKVQIDSYLQACTSTPRIGRGRGRGRAA